MLNGGMMAVEAVLERIDSKLAQHGMSDREASIAAVGKPDLIRDMRRGKGMPRGDRLAALARVLGTTSDWLINGGREGEAEIRAGLALEKVRSEAVAADISSIRRLHPDTEPLPPLPLLGSALAGEADMPEAHLELVELHLGEVLDYLRRPPSLASDRDAYALTVLADSMDPRFRPGERIIVSPAAPVSIGDDVVVQLRGPQHDNDDPAADRVRIVLVKQLVRRSASFIELHQFNPDETFRIEAARVASIHKVMGVTF